MFGRFSLSVERYLTSRPSKESIAEYTEKPLFAVNIGELSSGTDIVGRLETVFQLSVRWDAVLLIDEADVVLEKRSFENHQRNAIVSGKFSHAIFKALLFRSW